ncbi:GNAT family N-acetyltransferase [Streptomyces sp. NPDC029674]|uniref:GNAT family N-acetyltransferase n=1 Tax=Streptomyces sp. NPDC029674 TaxID=3365297 RepID=UPI00384B7276
MTGAELLARHAEGVRSVYAEAFGEPPWNEGPDEADQYLERRLAADVARPGFVAAVALGGGGHGAGAEGPPRVIGFTVAWTTGTPLPGTRSYPLVTAALGARADAWLGGARQVDELAVRPSAHGLGAGRALLAAVTRDAPDGRCWLLTASHAGDAVRFYRRVGWQQITHPAPDSGDVAVFLGPGHPALADADAETDAGRWRTSRR